MNAQQAKEVAKNNILSSEHDKIIKSIVAAANGGKFEVCYYDTISDVTRNKLTLEGYRVGKTQSDRNDILTLISLH